MEEGKNDHIIALPFSERSMNVHLYYQYMPDLCSI